MTQPRSSCAFVLAALCSVFLSLPLLTAAHPPQTTSPSPQKAAKLDDFSWLAGRWEGKLGPLTAEQEWMAPRNGTMQGFFRLTDNEKTIVIELFTIRETPTGIDFYFRHFSPELKPLEEKEAYHLTLSKSEGGVFRFDNPVVNQLKSDRRSFVALCSKSVSQFFCNQRDPHSF
jgi:hypothetical protein